MNRMKPNRLWGGLLSLVLGAMPALAGVNSQCPPDTDGVDTDGDGIVDNDHVCLHVTAGDGLITMADGRMQYIFGFHDVTGLSDAQVLAEGHFAADFPAPDIIVKQGQKLYISLTNVGMVLRPDLFDPHTIHWHGFPQASTIFDGVPGPSMSINMGSTLTYYYNVVEVGTYAWHCHVEATEHMQMGMLGHLHVEPIQNNLPDRTDLNGFTHRTGFKYAYNDGDGSTHYDVEYPMQLLSFDPAFHDADLNVQPLPFADMKDTYPMLNGRGYPDTVDPNPILNQADRFGFDPRFAQPKHAIVNATQGEKILLRFSSLSTVDAYSITTLGMTMRVVGRDGRLLRGQDGKDLSYETSSLCIAGGEIYDVIVDTVDVVPGTYFLYTANLNNLSNDAEDFGGMMTEIVIAPPASLDSAIGRKARSLDKSEPTRSRAAAGRSSVGSGNGTRD
ncbi:MAG: multicopper oxidase domain-containing protein [Phycisphaerae bacterium]